MSKWSVDSGATASAESDITTSGRIEQECRHGSTPGQCAIVTTTFN